jgi:hypothetical protein
MRDLNRRPQRHASLLPTSIILCPHRPNDILHNQPASTSAKLPRQVDWLSLPSRLLPSPAIARWWPKRGIKVTGRPGDPGGRLKGPGGGYRRRSFGGGRRRCNGNRRTTCRVAVIASAGAMGQAANEARSRWMSAQS